MNFPIVACGVNFPFQIIIYTTHGGEITLFRLSHQGRSRFPLKSLRQSITDGTRQLANGLSMPQIHLGVYLTSGKETTNAVQWALEARATLSAQSTA